MLVDLDAQAVVPSLDVSVKDTVVEHGAQAIVASVDALVEATVKALVGCKLSSRNLIGFLLNNFNIEVTNDGTVAEKFTRRWQF